ncbi:G-patch domain-containing protein [Citrus sinensis]|nr:G-patch domain-containing protein [Citrus sinensis]
MDYGWYNGKQGLSGRDKQPHEKEQAYQDSVIEDLAEDFRLPIHQKPIENVDLDDVEQASLDTKLTSSNIGFRLLQKMGWKGKGLGKDEQVRLCKAANISWFIPGSRHSILMENSYAFGKGKRPNSLDLLGIIEPIKSGIRDPKLGVGKQEEDDFFTAEENIQRRKLDIEVEDTEENAKKREKAAYTIYVCLLTEMVLAEREQKIQTEVKEIRKVFYCDLCNKQYKLAVEFEAHLSSYDHNHRKRFKEMREMHGTSSRDDRQKREQQRQEREMAKFAQMADAHKQQQEQKQRQQDQQQQDEESGSVSVPTAPGTTTALANQDQRQALKFGFSSKGGTSKVVFTFWSGSVECGFLPLQCLLTLKKGGVGVGIRGSHSILEWGVGFPLPWGENTTGSAAKKPKVAVASVFGDDSDEEQ